MVSEIAPETAPPDDLELPTLETFLPPQFPTDGELPSELQPKRARRSKKREREAIATVTEALGMVNAMFAMIAPCLCSAEVAARYGVEVAQAGAHLDTCAKLWPLDESEAEKLAQAIAMEFEAHPEWADRMQVVESWAPHIMLGSVIFGIVMERRMRPGKLMLPPGVDAPQSVNGSEPQFNRLPRE